MSEAYTSAVVTRVSSKGQEDEGYSLEAQVKIAQTYALNNALNPMKVFRITESASKAQQRKIFTEAMKFVADNEIKHLIVEKVDRHARNFQDAVETDDWLMADPERKIHFIKDGLVLHRDSRSQEKLNWGMRIVLAKNYIDNLREESQKGLAEKHAQGWLPSDPPPGYMTTVVHGKKIHVIDDNTAGLIRDAFSRYLDPNQSITTITAELAERGLRTSKGRPYARSKIEKILKNAYYIGINTYAGKTMPGAQETFIDTALFRRVQDKLHGKRPIKLARHNPVFKNLITCQDCGGQVTWQLQKGRYYGMCQRLAPQCHGKKSLREDRIEDYIQVRLRDLISPSQEIVGWAINEMTTSHADDVATRESSLKALTAQIERLSRMDNILYDDKLAGEITQERYREKHEAFEKQRLDIQAKIDRLVNESSDQTAQRIALLNLTQKAADLYRTRTVEQKRIIITKLFGSMSYMNGSVSVTYTKFLSIIADNVKKTEEILGGRK